MRQETAPKQLVVRDLQYFPTGEKWQRFSKKYQTSNAPSFFKALH